MPESDPNSYSAPEASHRYVLDIVRGADRERFLGALFAPEPRRSGLLSLLAFDHELARTRSVTREPMLARIRLEWWREAIAEAAGAGKPRAQPIVESLSETVRRHGLQREALVRLIDAREEEIEGPLDVMMAGHALADLELAVLGVDDAPSRQAAHAIGAAWLMGEGPERDQLVGDARALRRKVDPRALPILLPAVSLDRPMGPLRRPLAYWWSARRGRY
ncbi:squalene/phytoene synthase family protein [Reyranella sp. MMS21-HV4-11]|uniref:Squalene/phytoene synthase family protein n=1 Tax=Reyranella humidisoli TaxID=2849149 RepID=A0ABS6IPE0_9HYPH|nr:squalene/phytoene synthase family protein [Reyranella sp. MMS21-HV4-11]MBU8876235.1 squalene/phytoene synthase family protein [Reyranella sp. MMS21-HV4-11]